MEKGGYPIWQNYDEWRSLGLPDVNAPTTPLKTAVQTIAPKMEDIEKARIAAELSGEDSFLKNLFDGLFLGIAGYTGFLKRDMLIALTKKVFAAVKK